jgi:3-dehydroquinate synthetase
MMSSSQGVAPFSTSATRSGMPSKPAWDTEHGCTGEAVGCGMVLAAELSVRAGLIEPSYAARLRTLIARTGLPVKLPSLAD